jgi:hypothetical protein
MLFALEHIQDSQSQPPRKAPKHTRSSSVTNKPERRVPTVPLGTSNSLNIIASTSNNSNVSTSRHAAGSSRQPSVDPEAPFSDAPTLNTVDEDGDHVKLSGTSTGSGLTPSLTELGVGKVDDHPSSSRYMDAGEAARYEDELETQQMHHGHQLQQQHHQIVDVLPKLEETEEDLQRSQRSQHYHLEASAHELLSDAPDADQYDEHQHEHELEDHHQNYDQSATLVAPQVDEDDWLCLTKEQAYLAHAELNDVRSRFVDEVDELDCTMVAEYADEIFALMGQLEVSRGRVLCIQLR